MGTARAPHAVRLDGFHVVAWATEAFDQARRGMVNRPTPGAGGIMLPYGS